MLPTDLNSECRLVEDAIDEYALGLISETQRAAVERHLIQCKPCSELVTSYESTVAALAFAVPLVSPPANAKSVLMARVAATPQNRAFKPSVDAGSLETFRTPTLPASVEVSRSQAHGQQTQSA